jgi:hypothetical protein
VFGLTGADSTVSRSEWTTDDPLPTYATDADPDDVEAWTEAVTSWTERVQEELPEGRVSYRVDGLVRLPNPGNSDNGRGPYVDAQYLRVSVMVTWNENGRRREVLLEHVVM